MSEQHGTTGRYRLGCRCADCRHANTRYDKGRRLDILRGNPRTIDGTGTRRRIEALQALGWSGRHIAEASGYQSYQAIKRICERDRVTPATARRIDAAFDQLAMQHGPSTAARNHAARKGYAPPLAWDDDTIDDPTAEPHGVGYIPTDRAEALTELDALHLGISEVCARLNIRRDNLERWCERHGMREVYVRMCGRETWREVAS